MLTKSDLPVFFSGRKEDPPAVFRHSDKVEMGPAFFFHADCRSQIHFEFFSLIRPKIIPPVEVFGLPTFKSTLQAAVITEVDIVGNFFTVIDVHNFFPKVG